jgi:hypothetical protein
VGQNLRQEKKVRLQNSHNLIQRRLDLRALVRDFDSTMPRTYLDSIVMFFSNDRKYLLPATYCYILMYRNR